MHIQSFIDNNIAMFTLKTIFPDGIRTRVQCVTPTGPATIIFHPNPAKIEYKLFLLSDKHRNIIFYIFRKRDIYLIALAFW
jgi:hypothetical protein